MPIELDHWSESKVMSLFNTEYTGPCAISGEKINHLNRDMLE